MPKITHMFCYAVYDKDENDEGVIGIANMPMVGADIERAVSYVSYAQMVADETGKEVRLYKFTNKEQIMVIKPKSK